MEYAYRHQADYAHVFWVRAETQEDFMSGYVAMAQSLKLPGCQQEDQQAIVELMKRWLATHDGWLLVLDNADDLRSVRPFLPPSHGHILLTTRAHALGGLAQRLDVTQMEADEGALLLLRRAHVLSEQAELTNALETDQAFAQQLTTEMGGLPLALDQAGAYIEEQCLSLEEYLALFQAEKAELLQERGWLEPDHPSVTVTFMLAFEKVASANALSADLMRACAFLAPDAIPEEIFKDGAEAVGEPLSRLADPTALRQAIADAARFSLISRNPQAKTLTIHRLVQEVLRTEMAPESQTQWADNVMQAVTAVFPDADYENWAQCDRLLPQSQNTTQLINRYRLESETAALLLSRAGYYFNKLGRYSEAEPLHHEALAMRKRLLGDKHPSVAGSLNGLAWLYRLQGRYSDAEPLHQEALAMRKRLLGDEHPDVAISLHNLAALHYLQGRYSDAEPLHQEALAMRKRLLGDEHPDVADSLHELALLYNKQGRYNESALLYQKLLALDKQLLGDTHPKIATSLNNLALLYRDQGRYGEAEPLYHKALAMRKRLFGDMHPDVATSLNNLAVFYEQQGRYSEAESLFLEALVMSKRLLGEAHPDVADTLKNLAILYSNQGHHHEAESLFQKSLAIIKPLLGEMHPQVADTLKNLAILYSNQGRYRDAEPLFQEALAMQKRLLGAEHPDVATSLNNLASLYFNQGRYRDAELQYLQAVGIAYQQLGERHPNTQTVLNNFADCLHQAIESGKADTLSEHPITQDLLKQLQSQNKGHA